LIVAGQLVAVLEEWPAPFLGFYLHYPQQCQMAPALRVFIDFVKKVGWRELTTFPALIVRPGHTVKISLR